MSDHQPTKLAPRSGSLLNGINETVEYRAEPGSFRDRDGHIFYLGDTVFRGLSAESLADWETFSSSECFGKLLSAGKLVATKQVEASDAMQLATGKRWSGFLEHERIPFVSYPYEWTFGMLRDAALLQLEVQATVLEEAMTLKDASAYNIQWQGARPVFIDIPSVQRQTPGNPWTGYRQFCELFLNPLYLTAHKGIAFQPWLRGSLDGIAAADLSRLMSWRDLFRTGVFKHVSLQARLISGHGQETRDTRAELRNSGFNDEMIKANVHGLTKIVRGLTVDLTQQQIEPERHARDQAELEAFVEDVCSSARRSLIWSLTSDNEQVTRIAAENSDYVIAMDSDHLAVERLYQSLKGDGPGNILPLVNDLANPSPALGWRLRERKTLAERGWPDLTLCLTLIHHMVIGANVPMGEFIEWLGSLGSDLVIEFVTREDPMVKKLLLNKDDNYSDYDLEFFEQRLAEHFQIERRQELSSGTRMMYVGRNLGTRKIGQ
jgi:hypothetical protein